MSVPTQPLPWAVAPQACVVSDDNVLIGKGSFGEVRLAYYRGRLCTAKQVHSAVARGAMNKDFNRQMQLLSQLKHKNVVQFFGVVYDDKCNPAWILTEHVPRSLLQVVDVHHGNRRFSLPEIVHIVLQIAEGIQYLHESGTAHRNLTATNILVGNDDEVKLADVSQAPIMDLVRGHSAGPTAPSYCAPEAALSQSYTKAVDVYSFGVVLVQLCTNLFPDFDQREGQVLLACSRFPVLEPLIRACLEIDPRGRPAIEDVVETLRALRDTVGRDDDRARRPGAGSAHAHAHADADGPALAHAHAPRAHGHEHGHGHGHGHVHGHAGASARPASGAHSEPAATGVTGPAAGRGGGGGRAAGGGSGGGPGGGDSAAGTPPRVPMGPPPPAGHHHGKALQPSTAAAATAAPLTAPAAAAAGLSLEGLGIASLPPGSDWTSCVSLSRFLEFVNMMPLHDRLVRGGVNTLSDVLQMSGRKFKQLNIKPTARKQLQLAARNYRDDVEQLLQHDAGLDGVDDALLPPADVPPTCTCGTELGAAHRHQHHQHHPHVHPHAHGINGTQDASGMAAAAAAGAAAAPAPPPAAAVATVAPPSAAIGNGDAHGVASAADAAGGGAGALPLGTVVEMLGRSLVEAGEEGGELVEGIDDALYRSAMAALRVFNQQARDPAVGPRFAEADLDAEVLARLLEHTEDAIDYQEDTAAFLETLALLCRMHRVAATLTRHGVIELLVEALRVHHTAPDVALHGMAVLRHLANCEAEYQLRIVLEGGLEAILDALAEHSAREEVVAEALAALRNLAIHNADNKVCIARDGGLPAILDAMRALPDSAQVQAVGLGALWAFSSQNAENKARVLHQGGLHVILLALRRHMADHTGEVQERGLGVLRSLAADNSEHKVRIVQDAGLDVILEAMEACSELANVQANGLGALCNLSDAADIKQLMLREGGLRVVLGAMSRHLKNAGVQDQGLAALWSLTVCSTEDRVRIVQEGGVQAIFAAMNAHPLSVGVHANGLGAVANLAVDCPANQRAIVEQGGIGMVLSSMRLQVEHPDTQVQGMRALQNLVADSADCKARLVEEGGLAVVVDGLRKHLTLEEVARRALGALWNLVCNNSAHHRTIKAHAGLLEGLRAVQTTHAADMECQHGVARLLRALNAM